MSDIREQMPICAAWVDEFAKVFGRDQFTVTYAKENGIERGKLGKRGLPLDQIVIGEPKMGPRRDIGRGG